MASEIEKYISIVDNWRKKKIEKITLEDLEQIRSLLFWAIDLGTGGKDAKYLFVTRKLLTFVSVYLKAAIYGFVYRMVHLYKLLARDMLSWDEFLSSASKYTPYRHVFEDIYSAIHVLADVVQYQIPPDLTDYMNVFISVYTAVVHASGKEEFLSMFRYAIENTEFQSLIDVDDLPYQAVKKPEQQKKTDSSGDIYTLPFPYVVDMRFVLYMPIVYIGYKLLDIHAFIYFIQGVLVESIPAVAVSGIHLFLLRLSRVIFREKRQWWIITSLALISTLLLGLWNVLYLYMIAGYLAFWLGELLYYKLCGSLPWHDVYKRLVVSLSLLAVVVIIFHLPEIYRVLKNIVFIVFGLQ
ncbi:hypothetical protein GM182_01000 [bacterium 3DAC]|nr:hypothetical protein GM182_01000 [bacterium 3DAC]